MKLIDRYEFDYDVVTRLVEVDGKQRNVLATLVPAADDCSYHLEFPIKPPFTLINVMGVGVFRQPRTTVESSEANR